MTHEQQKVVDGFHEQAIALIFKRRQAIKYGNIKEEDRLTSEIYETENKRRAYEQSIKNAGDSALPVVST